MSSSKVIADSQLQAGVVGLFAVFAEVVANEDRALKAQVEVGDRR